MKSDDDDGYDSVDKKLFNSILEDFREQHEIIQYLFNFVDQFFLSNENAARVILMYPEFSDLLKRGLIYTENQ